MHSTALLQGNIKHESLLSARNPGTSGRSQSKSKIKILPQCNYKLKGNPCTVLAKIQMEDGFEMLKRFRWWSTWWLFLGKKNIISKMPLLWFVEVWEVRKGALKKVSYIVYCILTVWQCMLKSYSAWIKCHDYRKWGKAFYTIGYNKNHTKISYNVVLVFQNQNHIIFGQYCIQIKG